MFIRLPCCCYLLLFLTRYCMYDDWISRLPTDIQAESIPLILGGGDVLMVNKDHRRDIL